MHDIKTTVVRRNFIRTTNPFNLSDPPGWFLDSLAALDPELVIFASVQDPCYRLCRRLTRTRDVFRPVESFPDTVVTTRYRLAPWKSVLPTTLDMSWAKVLEEIPEYDTWRFKDGDAATDHLDALEAKVREDMERQQADDLDRISQFAYGVAARQLGRRVGLSDRGHRPVAAVR